MANFGPLAAEIGSLGWGTPANFNGFRDLAALLHGTRVVGVIGPHSKCYLRLRKYIYKLNYMTTCVTRFGRPFVKRFALCYLSVLSFLSVLPCLSCLSVTLDVYCGQTVGCFKMKLDTQVGLGRGHIVLDGDAAPLSQSGRAPNFRPMSIVDKRLDG